MALHPKDSGKPTGKEVYKAPRKRRRGRKRAGSLKPKIYPVDFDKIQNTHENLNDFQVSVLGTICRLTKDVKSVILSRLIVREAIEGALTEREKEVISLNMQGFEKGREIGEVLGISQPRANVLLRKAFAKLRAFLSQDCKL